MRSEPTDGCLPVNSGSRSESTPHGFLTYRRITLGLVLLCAVLAWIRFGVGSERATGTEPAEVSSQRDWGAREKGESDTGFAQRWPLQGMAKHKSRSAAQIDHVNDASHALDRLNQAVAKADARAQQTAEALKRFAATRSLAELRQLDRNDVIALADYLASELSPSELNALLEHHLGWSPSRVVTGETAGSTLVNIYDAIAGNHRKEVRPSVLVVTDSADADGRIQGQAHVLPAGAQRVYAVFENDRALEGLEEVLAIWRDPNDDKMVFTEFESVRKGSAYNYVWLEVASGWPAGRYQVELFHPEAQSLLLASEGFTVR